LVEVGADIAGVFGTTDVVDVLVAAGARIGGIVQAAAAGGGSGEAAAFV
jgi:hypothetical protein